MCNYYEEDDRWEGFHGVWREVVGPAKNGTVTGWQPPNF